MVEGNRSIKRNLEAEFCLPNRSTTRSMIGQTKGHCLLFVQLIRHTGNDRANKILFEQLSIFQFKIFFNPKHV